MFRPLPTASLRFSDLISPAYQFRIPSFQRDYQWTVKEAGQLLEDLTTAAGVEDKESAQPDYFLGAILLMSDASDDLPGSGSNTRSVVFDVVDGYQRIVTLTILAAVLRDLIAESAPEMAELLNAFLFVDASKNGAGGTVLRVVPAGPDREFLEAHVQRRGATRLAVELDALSASQRQIIEVRNHFVSELAALEPALLPGFASYVADLSHFVVILARDIDRAHRLFEVLNGRGKPLARNNILKAELIGQIPADRRSAATATWEAAARRLDAEFEQLFSHIRVIHGHHRHQVIADVRLVARDLGGAEPFILSAVGPLSEALQAILEPDTAALPLEPETRELLHYLTRLNGSEWIPATMLALHLSRDAPARALAYIREIDRFAHITRVLCLGSGKRTRRFNTILSAIKSGADINLAPGSGPFQFSREELRTAAFNLRDIHRRSKSTAKLLLLRLNDRIAGRFTPLEPSDFTIEHVLPQRPPASSQWRVWFPNATELASCIESLGNLALVDDEQNPNAKNSDFAVKKEIYRRPKDGREPLPLLGDILAASEWRAADIRAREARLKRYLAEMWRLDLSD